MYFLFLAYKTNLACCVSVVCTIRVRRPFQTAVLVYLEVSSVDKGSSDAFNRLELEQKIGVRI